jgi:hypothetical protein
MHPFAHDLRLALRQLRKTTAFTLTVILILALGIGATTSIFSLVEGILLRPLPFRNPDRLVLLADHLGGPNTPVTAREIGTYSHATSAFSSLGGYITTNYELWVLSCSQLPEFRLWSPSLFRCEPRRLASAWRLALRAPASPGSSSFWARKWRSKMALLGCGFGVLGSLALSRLVSSFLFDVSATDPLIYIVSVLIMMSMALLASALPATRAASSNPIDILRSS